MCSIESIGFMGYFNLGVLVDCAALIKLGGYITLLLLL